MNGILWQSFSALIGAVVVYVFGIRQLSIQRRNAFIERQLSELYSPMAGYRKRIRAKSELREKIARTTNEAWQENLPDSHEGFEPYRKSIDYDNAQFREELIPLYNKILDLFTEKYWLADDDTRAFYQGYLEYVEIWNRHLAESIPGEVITKLGHAEKNNYPFYEHLEQKISALQREVKDLRFWPRF